MRPQRITASPRARRALRQAGIDPAGIRGSGPAGRIVEVDVLTAGQSPRPRTSARSIIARRTSESFRDVPHFYLKAEADFTACLEFRESLRGAVPELPSITDFLLRAQAIALSEIPAANSIWQDEEPKLLGDVHVGLIVAVKNGLQAPVVKSPHWGTLSELALQRKQAVEQAQSGRVTVQAAAASSLSNLGKSRVDEFAAIIFPPQSTILTAGRVAVRPWVRQDRIEARSTVRLTLSVDHRVLDGEPAGRFLTRIVELLEDPEAMAESRKP